MLIVVCVFINLTSYEWVLANCLSKKLTLVSSTHLHMNESIWVMLYLKLIRLKYITKERMG
ncbi:hypothetical protein Hanom_Chr10g00889071 [Helianthus anomalus]